LRKVILENWLAASIKQPEKIPLRLHQIDQVTAGRISDMLKIKKASQREGRFSDSKTTIRNTMGSIY
jgi:hypothetical protein